MKTIFFRILSAKAPAPTADISALEAEIDDLAHRLYNLTAEGIAIVGDKK